MSGTTNDEAERCPAFQLTEELGTIAALRAKRKLPCGAGARDALGAWARILLGAADGSNNIAVTADVADVAALNIDTDHGHASQLRQGQRRFNLSRVSVSVMVRRAVITIESRGDEA